MNEIWIAFFISVLYLLFQKWPTSYKNQLKKLNIPFTSEPIAFFHPSCDQGGGGERVLWMGIQALQRKYPEKYIVIYTSSIANMNKIPERVKEQFGVELLQDKIRFAPLTTWEYLESNRYPRLTLILSSLGSLIPAFEAMQILKPKVLIESVGYAFIYPLAKIFGSRIVAYVHYPTISSDMLKRVERRKAAFNNNSLVANSTILSYLKLQYYRAFSVAYGVVGSSCDAVMVNSSWTLNHINQIWNIPNRTRIVYPPCDTKKLLLFGFGKRNRSILSISQFRPEKNHHLQIDIIAKLLEKCPELRSKDLDPPLKLILVGSVRNKEDKARVTKLCDHIARLKLESYVEIVENAPYSDLLNYLKTCRIGLHTMLDEHFGISLIEYMAAGLICLGNNSGGPKMDIVKHGETGFLASDIDGYSDLLKEILNMDHKTIETMQTKARLHVQTNFSEDAFARDFITTLKDVGIF